MPLSIRIFKARFTWLQILIHVGAWLPGIYLAAAYYTDNLTINPIQALTQRMGFTALVLLVLSLACTPANSLFGWRQALKLRRPLGIYAFLYASAHFLIFTGLDYGFDFALLIHENLDKPFILIGAIALLILLALAVTSFQWWMKRLGKKWKQLHRLIYPAALLVLLHFTWSQKGNLLRLQGEILQPVIFSLIVGILLLVRIPIIRRQINRLRSAFPRPPSKSQEKKQTWDPTNTRAGS